jgi:hypothetical protein
MDKEKFAVALGYCKHRFGTFTVGFERIPLSNIRLEHLFLLPIRTIMAYLTHHGIFYRHIPWTFKKTQVQGQEDDVLTGLQNMPVDTAPPFSELAVYMSDLMTYLNALMANEAKSYEIMYTQFQRRRHQQFPLEASRLRDDLSKYNLLERAVAFAFDIYHVGDIKEHCSYKWMIFIHYLMWGKFPSKNSIGYDTEQCIKDLLQLNIDQDDEEPPDLRRLLSGPPHLMVSFLKNNYRAKRLYGASVDGACQGIHRLMTSGVVLQWYMEYSKKNDVDDHIRSGDLCQMLSTKGVLQPTTECQPQFSSAIVPVHTLADAEAGVTAVIRSGMSVALTPPKHFLHPDPTAQEYREYYNFPFDNSLLVAMKAAVKRLPYSPRVRLPCTYSMVLHIIQQNTQQHSSKDCFMLAVGVSMAYYLCLRASEYVSKTKVPNPESHQFDSRSVEFKCFSTNYLVPSSSMHSICWTSVDIIRFTIQHAKNIRRGHGVPIWFSTNENNADAIAFLQLVYLWSRISTRLPDDPFLSYRTDSGTLNCLVYTKVYEAIAHCATVFGFNPKWFRPHSHRDGSDAICGKVEQKVKICE